MRLLAPLWMLPGLAAPLAVAGASADGQFVGASPPAMVTQLSQYDSRQQVLPVSGVVAKDAWKHYGPYDLPAGQALVARLTGTGDADLYVRKGATPTHASFDCRPHASTSNETCTVSGPAKVYVSVNGYSASSTFTLAISFALTRLSPSVRGSWSF